uniref:Putative secreted protein n=1 Tax=Amblyomma triste TaxID=251400 RepID=A0A023G2Y2_AMBTT
MHRCEMTGSALLLLLVATCAMAQQAVTLGKCEGEDYPSFKSVTVYPCESDPCVIKRDERYNVTFSVEATSDANTIHVTTAKQYESENTHINMVNSVSCIFLDVPCNVTKGEVFQGSVKLMLSQMFSPGELTYRLQVSDGPNVFACGQTKLTIE